MSRMKPREPGSPHEALADFFESIGIKRAAAFEDVHPATLYKLLDPDQDGEISFARVARLTSHFHSLIGAEYLASLAGAVVIPLPDPDRPDDLTIDAGLSAEQFGRLMTDLGQSIASGDFGKRDVRALLLDIHRVMKRLAALAEDLREKAEAR